MRIGRASGATILAAALLTAPSGSWTEEPRQAPKLPGKASRWVGGPVSWGSLKGQVTLVFVWTFG